MAATQGGAEPTVVFRSGDDDYHTYRIPALVRAANGDLLAAPIVDLGD